MAFTHSFWRRKDNAYFRGIVEAMQHHKGTRLSTLILAALYLAIALKWLPDYFPWTSVNFILGLIGMPLVIAYAPTQVRSSRFYPVTLFFGLLCLLRPEKTILFVALITAVIFLVEQEWRKLPFLCLLTIAMMSSTVQYLAGILSFPLRLSLTEFAGRLLNLSGTGSRAEGNLIFFGGNEYAVDPACMGIKMLLTSLLCGIFIIAVAQKKQDKLLHWSFVVLSLILVFILNLVSNIIRILILVFFDIKPTSIMHEAIGLICLMVYVLAPSIWVIQRIVKKRGVVHAKRDNSGVSRGFGLQKYWVLQGILLITIVIATTEMKLWQKQPRSQLMPIAGYNAAYYDADVIQYSNTTTLVYIKNINGVFGAEHNPVMCWLGCGYKFEKICETTINGNKVFTGTLKKGNERLFTAWWYDNGTDRTTSQIAWRWNLLHNNQPYSIINVTTADQRLLNEKVDEIMGKGGFKSVLEKR